VKGHFVDVDIALTSRTNLTLLIIHISGQTGVQMLIDVGSWNVGRANGAGGHCRTSRRRREATPTSSKLFTPMLASFGIGPAISTIGRLLAASQSMARTRGKGGRGACNADG